MALLFLYISLALSVWNKNPYIFGQEWLDEKLVAVLSIILRFVSKNTNSCEFFTL